VRHAEGRSWGEHVGKNKKERKKKIDGKEWYLARTDLKAWYSKRWGGIGITVWSAPIWRDAIDLYNKALEHTSPSRVGSVVVQRTDKDEIKPGDVIQDDRITFHYHPSVPSIVILGVSALETRIKEVIHAAIRRSASTVWIGSRDRPNRSEVRKFKDAYYGDKHYSSTHSEKREYKYRGKLVNTYFQACKVFWGKCYQSDDPLLERFQIAVDVRNLFVHRDPSELTDNLVEQLVELEAVEGVVLSQHRGNLTTYEFFREWYSYFSTLELAHWVLCCAREIIMELETVDFPAKGIEALIEEDYPLPKQLETQG
jgi:hypothetical protein